MPSIVDRHDTSSALTHQRVSFLAQLPVREPVVDHVLRVVAVAELYRMWRSLGDSQRNCTGLRHLVRVAFQLHALVFAVLRVVEPLRARHQVAAGTTVQCPCFFSLAWCLVHRRCEVRHSASSLRLVGAHCSQAPNLAALMTDYCLLLVPLAHCTNHLFAEVLLLGGIELPGLREVGELFRLLPIDHSCTVDLRHQYCPQVR